MNLRVFYLGDRSYSNFDFDGRVRRCFRISNQPEELGLIQVRIVPPLPRAMTQRASLSAGPHSTRDKALFLLRSRSTVPLDALDEEFPLEVHIVARISVARNETTDVYIGAGVAAPLPALLPLIPDRHFYEVLGLLYSFVLRTGTTSVPLSHRENGLPVGRWIEELRSRHVSAEAYPSKIDALPLEWRACLESLPGWTWKLPDER